MRRVVGILLGLAGAAMLIAIAVMLFKVIKLLAGGH